jgi:hypothetical protein
MEPWRAVNTRNEDGESRTLMEPWRAVDARYGDVKGRNGVMQDRGRSQWRRGCLKWSHAGPWTLAIEMWRVKMEP